MKILTFLLVLINILFFAFSQGQGGSSGPDAQRLKQQISPEQIDILSSGKPPGNGNTPGCLAWPELTRNLADQAAQIAVQSAAQDTQNRSIEPLETEQWWVMMPPQGSATAAQKKGDQLTALGITQYSIVRDNGPQQFALSLGLYATEAEATAQLANLQGAGVRSAKISKRPARATQLLQIHAPESSLQAIRAALAEQQPELRPRNCPSSN